MLRDIDLTDSPRILIVEDEALIAEEIQDRLTRLGFRVAGMCDTGEAAIEAAKELKPNLVLLDIRLKGEMDGITAADYITNQLQLPVVFLTAHSDEATRHRAKMTAPFGYILKPFHERDLLVTIEMSLHRHQLEQRLKESEQRYAATLASVADGVVATDSSGQITFFNRVAESVTQWSASEAKGLHINEVCPLLMDATRAPNENPVIKAMHLNLIVKVSESFLMIARNNEVIPIDGSVAPITTEQGNLLGAVLAFRDIREQQQAEEERRKLEAQIQHTQKLESLGVLAGGIAHDFNNLLTGILGYANLAWLALPSDSPARQHLAEAVNGAQRAAELTNQMLVYSGKGQFSVTILDLSTLVKEMSTLLEVSISKKSVLECNLADNLPSIQAEVAQLRQVIMNLIINASEAVGDKKGRVTLTTGTMQCDREYLSETYLDGNLKEGEYVYLEVTDTGSGMSVETREKIFDPFFTTKFTGRGLGLSAVLGIVRGHRGVLKVESELGKGTTFRIGFPAVDLPAENAKQQSEVDTDWQGNGTILVVDDEESVRGVAQNMLAMLGFSVLIASDGAEAIEVFRQHKDEICLVLLDLTMPNLDGVETFQELTQIRSDIKAVLSSGYAEKAALDRFDNKGLSGFIQKPYSFEGLKTVVREALRSTPL